MKTLPLGLLALSILGLPLVTACWPCEGGREWQRYTEDVTAVTLDTDVPVLVPLTVGASTRPSPDPLMVEIGMTDCTAGSFLVNARMLRADGTTVTAVDGFLSATAPLALQCPNRGIVFELPARDLVCTQERCTASVNVELTAPSGVGPREVEVRLVTSSCAGEPRNDGVIDAWGE
jgi:hypothetical protein